MTWMTPLLVQRQASDVGIVDHDATVDGERRGWPLTASALMHSVTADDGTFPATT